MNQNTDVEEREHQAWASVFHDGLWDLYLGLLLLGMGISLMLGDIRAGLSVWWEMLLLLPIMLLFWAGKRFITAPRLAHIEPNATRRSDALRVAIVITALLLGIVTLVLVLGGTFSAALPALTWIVVCIVTFSLVAYFTGVERLYLYGILYALPHAGRALLKRNAAFSGISSIVFFVSAGTIIAIGAGLLVRFWRAHPREKI